MRKLLFSISVFLFSLLFIRIAYATQLCSVSADVSTPTAYLDETVYTTISLTNYENSAGYTDVTAYLCKDDMSSCRVMDCDNGDPRVYLDKRGTDSLTCSIPTEERGYYKIKVTYEICSAKLVAYSNTFKVSPRLDECSIYLVDTDTPGTVRVGDDLDVFVSLKMISRLDPTAYVTVYVERYTDPSQTKKFYFPYSGYTDEKTFAFNTDGWQTGGYDVYVDAVGNRECGSLSKTKIDSVTLTTDRIYHDTSYTRSRQNYAITVERPYLEDIKTARDIPLKVEEVERVQAWSQTNVSTSSFPVIIILFLILLVPVSIFLVQYSLMRGLKGRNVPESF